MKLGIDSIVNGLEGIPDQWDKTATLHHRFTYKKGSKVLCVSVPAWRGKYYYDYFIKREALKKGYSYLQFVIPQTLLYPDCKITSELCDTIKHKMIDEINHFKERYSLEYIEITGLSIGCVAALLIANNNHNVTKINLVAPGNCLAESVWCGIRTKNLRRDYEKQGINLPFLKKQWNKLAPENNLHGLQGKDVSVYLSKSDRIIPFKLGRKLVEKMKEHGINPKVFINKFRGHYGTVVGFMLKPNL